MKHLLTFTAALMIFVISGCGAAPAKKASTPVIEANTPAGEKTTESKQATITKEEFAMIEMARLTLKSTKLLGVSGELVVEAGTKREKHQQTISRDS